MKQYKVYGHATVEVTTIVEAENEDEAIEKAEEICEGLEAFVGNGGDDKLIGVYNEETSIYCDDAIIYECAELDDDEVDE